ncbi:hypothetical protein [Scytonema sp. UIC 10036]|uniref:hypothetical protein n=1 Tax=Scytonema sp. UIC 10036 TaxID=2304196 RepID=UPI001FAAC793|nr:hypothetical protein [Scytonema sp. UIC 10036]
MTNVGQPPSIEERLSRLETLFANVGETLLAHEGTVNVLVAKIQQLTERVDTLTGNVNTVATRVDSLAEQAAQERQQAAIDRQEFRTEIRQIWEYLREEIVVGVERISVTQQIKILVEKGAWTLLEQNNGREVDLRPKKVGCWEMER